MNDEPNRFVVHTRHRLPRFNPHSQGNGAEANELAKRLLAIEGVEVIWLAWDGLYGCTVVKGELFDREAIQAAVLAVIEAWNAERTA